MAFQAAQRSPYLRRAMFKILRLFPAMMCSAASTESHPKDSLLVILRLERAFVRTSNTIESTTSCQSLVLLPKRCFAWANSENGDHKAERNVSKLIQPFELTSDGTRGPTRLARVEFVSIKFGCVGGSNPIIARTCPLAGFISALLNKRCKILDWPNTERRKLTLVIRGDI